METATKLPVVATNTRPFSLLIRPVAQNCEIVLAWENYQELKTKLLDSNDYQKIQDRQYIKKSGWRKLQTAFGISDELIKEERKDYKTYFAFEITTKVSAQNGRSAFGVGSCASNERRFAHPEHDVRSTAHTRAKNRAISDLIGGGEVSAEEVNVTRVEEVKDDGEINHGVVAPEWSKNYRAWEDSKITEKQRNLLRNLILEKVGDENLRENMLAQLPDLSKYDAAQQIDSLIKQGA